MDKTDECDKDVAAILGLEQAAVPAPLPDTDPRRPGTVVALIAVVAVTGVALTYRWNGHEPSRPAPATILHNTASLPANDRADMLLPSAQDDAPNTPPNDGPQLKPTASSGDEKKLSARKQQKLDGSRRNVGLRKFLLAKRSQALARQLNLAPSTSFLRLASSDPHILTQNHSYGISRTGTPYGANRARQESERTVQAERLDAIDAIRILRQR